MNNKQRNRELMKGFVDTIPLGLSACAYGIVYGVMASKAGLSIYETTAMSAIVFAGAAQMTAVQMIAIGSSPLSVIITVLIINLRHFLLSASISPFLKEESNKMKMVNSFFLTDESYAVTYSHYQGNRPNGYYFLGSGLNIYILWGSASVIGYLFGNIVSSELNYIFDFAFVAAFLGMIVPMVKDFPAVVTVLASGIISIIGSQIIPGKWYIMIAGVMASILGYFASTLIMKEPEVDVMKGGIDCEY